LSVDLHEQSTRPTYGFCLVVMFSVDTTRYVESKKSQRKALELLEKDFYSSNALPD